MHYLNGGKVWQLQVTPASVRSWHYMLKDQETSAAISEYTSRVESPSLVGQEISAAVKVRGDGMELRASGVAREVVASVEVDEGAILEIAIRVPECYPLQAAEVLPAVIACAMLMHTLSEHVSAVMRKDIFLCCIVDAGTSMTYLFHQLLLAESRPRFETCAPVFSGRSQQKGANSRKDATQVVTVHSQLPAEPEL
jgi:hypothetical protein